MAISVKTRKIVWEKTYEFLNKIIQKNTTQFKYVLILNCYKYISKLVSESN